MARRHRRHSRRGKFGFLKLPKISGQVKDTGVGALIGIGGAAIAMLGANKYNEAQAAKNGTLLGPGFLLWAPALGGGLAAFAGSKYGKKKGKSNTYFAGAALAGLAISLFKWIQQNYSEQFGDLVRVRLAGMGNVLVKQGALGNLLIGSGGGGSASPVRKARLGALAMSAMSPAARSAMRGYLRVNG